MTSRLTTAATAFPSDASINKLMSSYGIQWHKEDVNGLSFLGAGKARESWERFAKKGASFQWDRIGRIRKTQSGTEWLLVKRYNISEECAELTQGLSCTNTGRIQFATCTSLTCCINIIEFLRIKGVCCRLLLVLPSDTTQKQAIENELDATGVWEKGKIKNRVFSL